MAAFIGLMEVRILIFGLYNFLIYNLILIGLVADFMI